MKHQLSGNDFLGGFVVQGCEGAMCCTTRRGVRLILWAHNSRMRGSTWNLGTMKYAGKVGDVATTTSFTLG